MPIAVFKLLVIVAGLMAGHAHAQNTGGVFGPVVNEGHRSFQYRAQYDPDAKQLANRLHYQQSLNGENMWRLVAQTRHGSGTDSGLAFLLGELFWQLTDDSAKWQQGVRFDYRYRDDGRPDLFGFNWMHEVQVSENWRARAILLTGIELGSGARDGILLSTRGQLARSLANGRQFGLELYDVWGSTDDIPDLSDQFHQLGAYFSTPVGGGFSLLGRALFGLTDRTPDFEIGLWIGRDF